MLAVRTHGAGPPLTALHGFTATGDQFAPLAAALGRTIRAPDLPGHGSSSGDDTSFDGVVSAISSLIDGVPVVGYSQGARLALAASLEHPGLATSLVLVSGSAGIERDDERARRLESDRALADNIREVGVETFLDEWTSDGITSTTHLSPDLRSTDRSMRLSNTADGLARAVAGYGQGAQPSYWHRLGEVDVPVLVVAGERDAKYVGIARRMATLIPDATVQIVANAGHNPMLDDLRAVSKAISGFLSDRA